MKRNQYIVHSDEARELAIQMWIQGASQGQIVRATRISQATISRLLAPLVTRLQAYRKAAAIDLLNSNS